MEIKVYGSNECPHCKNLKRYLKILRIPFTYVDVDLTLNESEYSDVIKELKHNMIPVIKIDGRFMSPDVDFDSISGAVKQIFNIYKNKSKKSI